MGDDNTGTFLIPVARYYSAKLAEYGQTARGVDWKDEQSQILRFSQLTKLIASEQSFSINDLGCGYGALYDYLKHFWSGFLYTGCDISEAMVSAARSRHTRDRNARYLLSDRPPDIADYGVASGIFNVRLGHNAAEWQQYLESTLAILNQTSAKGFAFNCLTSYSDPEKMRDYLYYGDPCHLFDLCKRRYSRDVALLHDYGLYEFTIIVKK